MAVRLPVSIFAARRSERKAWPARLRRTTSDLGAHMATGRQEDEESGEHNISGAKRVLAGTRRSACVEVTVSGIALVPGVRRKKARGEVYGGPPIPVVSPVRGPWRAGGASLGVVRP